MSKSQIHTYLKNLQEYIFLYKDIKPITYDEQWLMELKKNNKEWERTFEILSNGTNEEEKIMLHEKLDPVRSMLNVDAFAQLEQWLSQTPTPYEQPFYYNLLLSLQTEIEQAIKLDKTLNTSVYKSPIVGTLPSGEVNACILPFEDTHDTLLLFDSQLFNFANLLSKLVARAMRIVPDGETFVFSTESRDVFYQLLVDPNLGHDFAELIVFYFIGGNVDGVIPYLLPVIYAAKATELINAFELFVMAHEYGHLLGGHLKNKPLARSYFKDGDQPKLRFNWEEEYEADLTGTLLAAQALQKKGLSRTESLCCGFYFMHCVLLVERGIILLRTGDDEMRDVNEPINSSSHPPIGLRIVRLLEGLGQKVSAEELAAVKKYSHGLFEIIEILWFYYALPQLKELHKKGVKPSNLWDEIYREHQGSFTL